MQPAQLSKEGKKFLKNIEFDGEEKLVCEIKKHPFGLSAIYFGGVFSAVAVLAIFIIAGQFASESGSADLVGNTSKFADIMAIGGGILALFIIIVTAIGAYLYKHNVILVTSQKVAQLLSNSLFNRKISQLGIGDVQDVTVKQKGIFAHMFKYGTIIVETAGEQQNYTFTYAPDPYQCARNIISAREQDIKKHGN